jgi:hypothetical protein
MQALKQNCWILLVRFHCLKISLNNVQYMWKTVKFATDVENRYAMIGSRYAVIGSTVNALHRYKFNLT